MIFRNNEIVSEPIPRQVAEEVQRSGLLTEARQELSMSKKASKVLERL